MSLSLNKYMHPRNRYKKEKPSFLNLALKYPEFRAKVTQDDSGKVLLDFKDAEALRALTTCLLKEDFDLTVEMPPNRLVPTLPLRLNYIHWLEDIVGKDKAKWGIDIGTGASCVYPLLAAKMNNWHFLATEADEENAFHADKNIQRNDMSDLIKLKKVTTEDALLKPLEELSAGGGGSGFPQQFDFCMCNPPFFADHMEAQALDSRSADRKEPHSVSTASPEECIAAGGEVGFVRQMIEESVMLKGKVRVYTSMVGKKSSLPKLKEELRQQKISNFSTTEFCQGKTMRWGIAWTFDTTVVFPRSEFKNQKEKGKPPLQYIIPKGAGDVIYEVHTLATYIKDVFKSIKVHVHQGKKAKAYSSITVTAAENTWCNQRRLRRQQQRLAKLQLESSSDGGQEDSKGDSSHVAAQEENSAASNAKSDDSMCNTSGNASMNSGDGSKDETGGTNQDVSMEDDQVSPQTKKRPLDGDDSLLSEPIKKSRLNDTEITNDVKSEGEEVKTKANSTTSPMEKGTDGEGATSSIDAAPKKFILKCVMRLKRGKDDQIQLELDWLQGESRELMYQLFTFLKNKLIPPKKKD